MREISAWVSQPWEVQPLSDLDWQTLRHILCDRSHAVYQLINDLHVRNNLPLPRNHWPGKIAELNNAVKLVNHKLGKGSHPYKIASATRGGGWQVFMLSTKQTAEKELPKKARISVDISFQNLEALQAISAKGKLTLSDIVDAAVDEYLNQRRRNAAFIEEMRSRPPFPC